jgi:hypothetical protein
MKIRQVDLSCSMRTDRLIEEQTDGRTDMTKLVIAFAIFRTRLKTQVHTSAISLYSTAH